MRDDARFPRFVAETLSGSTLVLPDSLGDRLAVVALAFRRHAQPIVDSWLIPVSKHYADSVDVEWYEIPMLAGGWRMVSGFIDGGMRSGIRPEHHDHVATCYGDLARVQNALEVHDLDSAYVYLVTGEGRVLWSSVGWAHQRRLDQLFETADNALKAFERPDSLDE
ncbi:MAG: hypothetical protein ACOC2Y_07455 [Spirochaetota bacterium]